MSSARLVHSPAHAGVLDLDVRPVELPRRPRRSLPALLVAAALVGLLGAGSVHAATSGHPAAPPAQAAVTVAFGQVLLDPVPTAVLEVTVENRDDVPLHLGTVRVTGPGVAGAPTSSLDQDLDVGDVTTAQVRVPLGCATSVAAPGAPQVTVDVAGGATRTATTVTALPAGRTIADGLCAAASALPPGWEHPMLARGFRGDPGQASALLAGLPSGSSAVLAVHADDWTLPVRTATVHDDGTAELTVGVPAVDCRRQPQRAVLPSGLTILVRGSGAGPVEVYLPLGPDLARWISRAWHAACPGTAPLPSRDPPTGIDIHASDWAGTR